MGGGSWESLGTEDGALAQGSAGVLIGIGVVFELKETAAPPHKPGGIPGGVLSLPHSQALGWLRLPGAGAVGGLLPARAARPSVHRGATRGQQRTTVFSRSPPRATLQKSYTDFNEVEDLLIQRLLVPSHKFL